MPDHWLVPRPVLASYRSAQIHHERLHDESMAFATDVKVPKSDYAPVVAAFRLPA